MSDSDPALIGRKHCGCIVFVGVDRRDTYDTNQKELAAVEAAGGTVERVTVAQAREALTGATFGPCAHETVIVPARQLGLGV